MYIDIHTHVQLLGSQVFHILNCYPISIGMYPENTISLGLHPWHINEKKMNDELTIIHKHAYDNNVVAIGETGLDEACDTPYELQEHVFLQHLDIAEKVKKPVIIHCVRAYAALLTIRKQRKTVPWILHGFSGSTQLAADFARQKCYISIGERQLHNETKILDLVSAKRIPVFLETDERNTENIVSMYEKIAYLKGISVEELKDDIAANFKKCFGFKV